MVVIKLQLELPFLPLALYLGGSTVTPVSSLAKASWSGGCRNLVEFATKIYTGSSPLLVTLKWKKR
jgi:hypothetical protein